LRGPDFDVTEELRTLESDEQKQNQKEIEENHNEKIVDEKKSSMIVRVHQTILIVFKAIKIQWKPLNVIALGQTKTDNINPLLTITN
jgi:hypothetical protein